jgi:uncharacterized protein (TIGR02271 family)
LAKERGDRFTEFEERYARYEVYDPAGEKIGRVDYLFVDENDQPEYIGVKLGLLGTKSTLIPWEVARVDEERGRIEVPVDKDRAKDGPAFEDAQEITPEFEERVRSYYGLGAREVSGQRGAYSDYRAATDEDELRVERTEEELRAGTREREAGEARVRKSVRTEREQVRVPKRHEEVHVDRVPVEGKEASEAEIGEDEVSVPVTEEEVVVEKRPEVKEEVRVRKTPVEEEEVVEEDVRREEIEIEEQTEPRREAGTTGQTEQQPQRAHSERRAEEEEPPPPRDEGFKQRSGRDPQGQSSFQSDRGSTNISDTVVQKIAGIAAQEVEKVQMGGGAAAAVTGFLGSVSGAVSGSSSGDGSPARGVSVEVGEEEAAVDLTMAIEYGVSIPQVTEAVRRNVINRVENLTGLRVAEVNIVVNDVQFPEERPQLGRQQEVEQQAQEREQRA